MKTLTPATCRLILATALAFAALPLAAQPSGPSTSASLDSSLPGFPLGDRHATPNSLSTSHQQADIEDSGSEGSRRARGYAVNGVVGASAQVSYDSGYGGNGFIKAQASANWVDAIDLVLPSRFTLTEQVDHYELMFNVGATGSVSGTGTIGTHGFPLVTGNADIDYQFIFGGKKFEGYQSFSSGDGVHRESGPGTWGTIAGTFNVNAGDSVSLSMAGHATALVQNYNLFAERHATANADFGSTLIWGGITHVTAFNVSGGVIPLPDDFQLDLIGRQSGFNYWYAAEHPDAPHGVPESTPALLLLAPALFGLALVRRRQGAT